MSMCWRENLLKRHRSSLSPQSREGVLSQLKTCRCHYWLRERLCTCRGGNSNSCSYALCSSPKLCGPRWISLCKSHPCQTFLNQVVCVYVVALIQECLRKVQKRPSNSPRVTSLSGKVYTLLCQTACLSVLALLDS